jgi:LEA14-like dessication related protein
MNKQKECTPQPIRIAEFVSHNNNLYTKQIGVKIGSTIKNFDINQNGRLETSYYHESIEEIKEQNPNCFPIIVPVLKPKIKIYEFKSTSRAPRNGIILQPNTLKNTDIWNSMRELLYTTYGNNSIFYFEPEEMYVLK